MIVYIILIILVFTFASTFLVGIGGKSTVKHNFDLEDEHRKSIKQKSNGMIAASVVCLIIVFWIGTHFKGVNFIYWFCGTFLVRYLLELRWSRQVRQ